MFGLSVHTRYVTVVNFIEFITFFFFIFPNCSMKWNYKRQKKNNIKTNKIFYVFLKHMVNFLFLCFLFYELYYTWTVISGLLTSFLFFLIQIINCSTRTKILNNGCVVKYNFEKFRKKLRVIINRILWSNAKFYNVFRLDNSPVELIQYDRSNVKCCSIYI